MLANPRSADAIKNSKHQKGLTLVEFVVAFLVVAVLAALFLPSASRSREAARRSQCKNNLKQIAIALHNYHDKYRAFPPACTVDADGKPLHSWRTLILPYLEQKALYDKIDLTKPWNDPANADAFKTILDVYRCPSEQGPATHTIYLALVTSNSCLRLGESSRLSDIKDGASSTLLVTEVDSEHAVPWMAPIDADISLFLAIRPTSELVHTSGVHAVSADGTVRFLNAGLSAEIRHALISIDGNEPPADF